MTPLTWADCDPQRHPAPTTPDELHDLEHTLTRLITTHHGTPAFHHTITHHLTHHYGPWARTWSTHHTPTPDTWCCTPHSVDPEHPRTTATLITDNLRRQRAWYEHLATVFTELTPPPHQTAAQHTRHLHQATTRLINLAVTHTDAMDAWYLELHHLLALYLTHQGHTHPDLHEQIETLLEDRFDSWTGPDPTTTTTVATDIAHAFTPR
ncbi:MULTISPECIES: hypothetical protein [unclassified Nocardiopsis]|uniref:hypothetical protein n=1 Tax=unclassified Nocardiopsis TaxID=2649073 RepID=UPI0033C9F768